MASTIFLGTVVLFVGSLSILIAAYASAVNGVAVAVPILTLLMAIPSFLTLMVHLSLNRRIPHPRRKRQRKDKNVDDVDDDEESTASSRLLRPDAAKKFLVLLDSGLRPTAQSVALFFGPSMALFLITLLRLIAGVDNFWGDPSNLDFGPKYGDPADDAQDNIAFTPDFTSVGHCLQGVLASLLAFPAVSGLLTQLLTCQYAHWWTECNKYVWSLVRFIATTMCIYPIYNLVKRLIKAPEAFAASSYCNNSLEWAWGFMVGIALGNFVTILVKRKLTIKIHSNGAEVQQAMEQADGQSWVLSTQQPLEHQPKLTGLQFLLGVVFMFSVFTAAVLFGMTWHTCIDGGDQCVNYSEETLSKPVLATFIVIPTVVIFAMSCGECMRLRR